MTRPKRTRRAASPHQVPRTARLNELLREIIGEELGRIGDERLELVSITSVDVDADLNRAIVTFDALNGEASDAEVLAALGELRVKLQRAVGSQMVARKTPILEFRPDTVIRSAERIDELLRSLPPAGDHDEVGDGRYRTT
jgi:ribosome-binding factor A